MSESFRVEHIDHVEVFVPDPYEAATWYERILGLRIVPEYERWADSGPLMISSDGGNTMLALFKGEAQGSREVLGHQRVAFRVDGPGFIAFLDRLEEHPVYDHRGMAVNRGDAVDHDGSFSIYFCDPWGNRYEVTSYDCDSISARLA